MSWQARLQTQVGELRIEVALGGGRGPVALVGPNGAGKTTLLRALAGAHRPVQGEVVVDGVTLLSSAGGIDRPIEERGVGYLPQGYGLFPHLRALDNVAFGLRGPDRVQRARSALASLDCGALAARRPSELSGGEQQRVALARALVREPRLLLLDEPLAALDVSARRSVRASLVERLRTLGCPSLVVTHDLRDVQALHATVFVLEGGRVVQQGELAALRAAPATEFVAEFVGAG